MINQNMHGTQLEFPGFAMVPMDPPKGTIFSFNNRDDINTVDNVGENEIELLAPNGCPWDEWTSST